MRRAVSGLLYADDAGNDSKSACIFAMYGDIIAVVIEAAVLTV